jgi:hypothetical protein
MRKIMVFVFALSGLWAAQARGQVQVEVEPLGLETRYDSNVFRLVSEEGRLSDEIDSLSAGVDARATTGPFKAHADYSLNADTYQFYSQLNNFTHDLNFDLLAEEGNLSAHYTNDSFFRSSGDYEFDYFDEANLLGLDYSPEPTWNLEAGYEILTREYYNDADYVASRNFTDNGVALSAQKTWSESFGAKFEMKWNDRQFNRYAVQVLNSGAVTYASSLQNDDTLSADLGFHLYFLKILQDIHLSAARTNSNSYGFSNAVESVSWAGVLSPVKDFYLELFFRLYEKDYDFQPLVVPDLQLGFTNDDGQDLLAAKGTWEWAPGWTGSLGVSRVKNESTQPGQYYIKDVVSAQIKMAF